MLSVLITMIRGRFILGLIVVGWAWIPVYADTDMEVTGNLKVTSTSGNGNVTAAGSVGIGVTSPGSKLEVKGTTGTSVVAAIKNEGTSTHTSLELHNANSAPSSFRNGITGKQSRGTLASPTALASGDQVLSILAGMYAGSAFGFGAGISFYVDGTPGTSDYPGRITFETAADGSSTRTERMRITNNGNIGIGGIWSPGEKLEMNGVISLFEVASPIPDSDFGKVYAYPDSEDVVEVWVKDGGGDATQISSHRDPRCVAPSAKTSFGDPSVALPFSFHHSNAFTGKGAVVDLAALVKDVESVTGKTYTYIYDLSPEEILDFEQWREEQRAKRDQRAREEALAVQPEVEVSLQESYEDVPEMEVVEAVEQITEYRIDFDTLQVQPVAVERKVHRESPTGRTKRQLKADIRFEPETGKLWRRRTLEEVQVATLPAPTLPDWVAARIPVRGHAR